MESFTGCDSIDVKPSTSSLNEEMTEMSPELTDQAIIKKEPQIETPNIFEAVVKQETNISDYNYKLDENDCDPLAPRGDEDKIDFVSEESIWGKSCSGLNAIVLKDKKEDTFEIITRPVTKVHPTFEKAFDLFKFLDEGNCKTEKVERINDRVEGADRFPKFFCSYCDASYVLRNSLNFHIRVKHKSLKFSCPLCNAKYSTKFQLDKHKASHAGLTDLIFCSYCDESFQNRLEYLSHCKVSHSVAKSYLCPFCDAQFSYKPSLKFHKRTAHGEIEPFKCNRCDFCSAEKHSLDGHIENK